MTLSLPVENTLEKCISSFLKDVTIDKSDRYKCDKCQKVTKKRIRNELCKLPDIFVFHLKRFTYPQLKKIKGRVTYSPTMEMSKFAKNALDEETEYELVALTVHIGTLNKGHYIAFTKRE